MLADVEDFDFADGGEDLGDAGVGDDDVESCDIVSRLEFFNGGGGVGGRGAFDLDDDEGAVGAFDEIWESFGGRMSRVANPSYDDVVWETQIVFDEALSKTCATTEQLFVFQHCLNWNLPLLPPVTRMVVFVDMVNCKC